MKTLIANPPRLRSLIRRALAMLVFALATAISLAQPTIEPSEAPQHIGDVVRIQGITGEILKPPSSTTRAFSLRGKYDSDSAPDRIVVRTHLAEPWRGCTYIIEGQVFEETDDSGNRVAELIEQRGWRLSTEPNDPDRPVYGSSSQQPVVQVSPNGSGAVAPTPGMSPVLIGLLVATALVFIALMAIVYRVMTSVRPGGYGAGMQVAQEGTVKLMTGTAEAIQKGTVKVLPGRFRLTEANGSSRDLRLMKSAQNPGREFLLKRVPNGAPLEPNVIGFSDQSVSSNQGKLLLGDDNIYTIINLADPVEKNAIGVNGRGLGLGEFCKLSDGDEIVIGNVKLKYMAT
jgi:hypothetical protein